MVQPRLRPTVLKAALDREGGKEEEVLHVSQSNEVSFSQRKGLQRTYCDQRARSPVQTGVSKRGGLVPQSWAASSGLEPSALRGHPAPSYLCFPLWFFFFFIFCALPSARASWIAGLPRVSSRGSLSPLPHILPGWQPRGDGHCSVHVFVHESREGRVTRPLWDQ